MFTFAKNDLLRLEYLRALNMGCCGHCVAPPRTLFGDEGFTLPAVGAASSRALLVVSPLWGLCPASQESCLTQGHDPFPGYLHRMTDQHCSIKGGLLSQLRTT